VLLLVAYSLPLSLSYPKKESWCHHRIQLVGGFLLEPLVGGSKSSGVRMFLHSWGLGPHMSNQGTLVHRCRESQIKTIQPSWDRTPGIGFHYPNLLDTNNLQSPYQLLAESISSKTAQLMEG
jgi:hypothetical protein